MSFFERLAYVSLSATGVAVILLVHYLLSHWPSTTTTTTNTVNRNSNSRQLLRLQRQPDESDADGLSDDDDDAKPPRRRSTTATTTDRCDTATSSTTATASNSSSAASKVNANDDDDNVDLTTASREPHFLQRRRVVRASMAYRPRGLLARAVYEKVHNDQYLDGYDMQLWYKLTRPLDAERFQQRFVPMEEPDRRTLHWLDAARKLSSNFWLQLWHVVARMVLTTFMTQTDANGFLKRGSMFILSEEQFARLLSAGGFRTSTGRADLTLLDIGAGDGEVSQRLINAVRQLAASDAGAGTVQAATDDQRELRVYATEYSYTMRNRLKKKNFTIIDKITEVSGVDLIVCLNVLDRCADPHQIMADIYAALADDGRVIVALVLPYSHYVESTSSHMPLRTLLPHWPSSTQRLRFDAEAQSFFEQLEQMGFNIESWTKAPYLCEGDMRQSFYWLLDVVVVLSKRTPAEMEAAEQRRQQQQSEAGSEPATAATGK